jgi:hypothetical protein
MRTAFIFLASVLSAAFCQSAHADWTDTGVAALCDPSGGRFLLLSVIRSSDPEADYDAPEASEKSLLLPIEFGSNTLKCRLSPKYEIVVDLVNAAPSAAGQGNGSGYVQFKLLINGVSLMGTTGFNEVNNSNRETMMRLELQANGDTLGIAVCSINGWANRNDSAARKCTRTAQVPANNSLQRDRDR